MMNMNMNMGTTHGPMQTITGFGGGGKASQPLQPPLLTAAMPVVQNIGVMPSGLLYQVVQRSQPPPQPGLVFPGDGQARQRHDLTFVTSIELVAELQSRGYSLTLFP